MVTLQAFGGPLVGCGHRQVVSLSVCPDRALVQSRQAVARRRPDPDDRRIPTRGLQRSRHLRVVRSGPRTGIDDPLADPSDTASGLASVDEDYVAFVVHVHAHLLREDDEGVRAGRLIEIEATVAENDHAEGGARQDEAHPVVRSRKGSHARRDRVRHRRSLKRGGKADLNVARQDEAEIVQSALEDLPLDECVQLYGAASRVHAAAPSQILRRQELQHRV